jgi:hypothetical protein
MKLAIIIIVALVVVGFVVYMALEIDKSSWN